MSSWIYIETLQGCRFLLSGIEGLFWIFQAAPVQEIVKTPERSFFALGNVCQQVYKYRHVQYTQLKLQPDEKDMRNALQNEKAEGGFGTSRVIIFFGNRRPALI